MSELADLNVNGDHPRGDHALVRTSMRDIGRVKNLALFRLGRSAQSRQALFDAATRKGFSPETINIALDELEAVGLIDDTAFAVGFVESRRVSRGLSAGALRRELRSRGISPELADGVTESFDSDDDAALALEFARRKAPGVQGLPRDKAVRRLVGQLARRGHSPGVAFATAKSALDELDPVDD